MRFRIALSAAVAVGVLAVGGIWMLQDRLIYFPGAPPPPWRDLQVASSEGLGRMAWLRESEVARSQRLLVMFP